MPPAANIQGLNIVQPQQAPSDSQDLLSGQTFSDISAQLDLWTNLTFDTDDGSLSRNEEGGFRRKAVEEEEDEAKSPTAGGEKAIHDGHANVTTNLGTNPPSNEPQPSLSALDLNALLSGFAMDPFTNLSQPTNQGAITPSLAQLLALHSHAQQFPAPVPPAFTHYPVPPGNPYSRLPHIAPTIPAPAPAPAPTPVTQPLALEEPPTKRARARKASISSPEAMSPDPQNMTLVAAEDKRRRNTAASARFRLKKKEREAALEGKAKELEARVNELERECEGLRRENGWLKGLVVGVTGAAQAPVVTSPPPTLSPSQLASLTNATAVLNKGREELDK